MTGRKRRSLARNGESLARRSGFRQPRKTIMVLCEGERSEPEYIQALKREHDVREVAAVEIVLDDVSYGWSPMTLVQRAVKLRQETAAENAEVDEVWCVFDVEWPGSNAHHPNLREAVRLAKANGVHVAISNPSFELWLILHFRECGRFLTNSEAKRLRALCDGSTGKGVNAAAYMPRRADAARRARLLDKKHEGDGTDFPENNPSSGMHLLLASATTVVIAPDTPV